MRERVNLYILVCLILSFVPMQAARFSWDRYKNRSDEWFRSDEGSKIAEDILAFQSSYGSWPKNIDTATEKLSDSDELEYTFDNGATTGEMRFMAHAFNVTGQPRYQEAFLKGLDCILKAQYPTGGWPQMYPCEGYHCYITFNDDAMANLMVLLREVAHDSEYDFVDTEKRQTAQKAFDAGIECILKCQVRVNGKRTVWCAQHDPVDYSPRPARSYELVSLSGGESAGILKLLMSLDNPSPKIIKAVTAGVNWYKETEIKGIRPRRVNGEFVFIKDPDAPPVWGRFCEIGTNRPFFCDRDGVPKYDINEIGQERRTGYAWYGGWGREVFREYDQWRQKWADLLLPEGTKVLAIIGDSTVCNWPENDVRRGWGQVIQNYFSDSIKVINKARSGRSSKTFIQQGLWQKVLDLEPDYILIQFGHNDSHDPDRPEATDANGDYMDYLRQYIDQARRIGAKPVLVTPMYRRKFDEQGNIHDNLLPYANAMKKVAVEKNVPFIDLNAASEKLYLQIGPAHVQELANAPDDSTHFNEKGAKAMAELVIQQLPDVVPSLKVSIK